MAIGREPSAWVNAARMDTDFNGVYLYVEGKLSILTYCA